MVAGADTHAGEDMHAGADMGASDTGHERRRYGAVAILFHWVIAALILYQIGVGIWMSGALEAADEATRFAAFELAQTHKAVGLTVLALSLLRLAWRIAHPAPPLPSAMPFLEKAASTLSHWAFYALMIAMPLSGWAMVSTSQAFSMVPTSYFGLFAAPHLPHAPLEQLAPSAPAGAFYAGAHAWLAYGALALLVIHVAAALRHHLFLHDGVLARMVPGLAPRDPRADMPPARPAGGLRRGLAAALALATLAGAGSLALVGAPRTGGGAAGEMAAEEAGDLPRWAPDYAASEIGFSGMNAGAEFEGVFESWQAAIAFDPDRLEDSRVAVEIQVASAKTGTMQYDGSLASEDWLAPETHPVARYEATRFRPGEAAGTFVAEGALTLRGVENPLELPFTLTIDGDQATVEGATEIDRLAYQIGVGSDPQAAWVSKTIGLKVFLTATRIGAADAGS